MLIMYVIKCKTNFEDYKSCLQNNEIILKLQQRLSSIVTGKVSKITLSAKDEDNKYLTE